MASRSVPVTVHLADLFDVEAALAAAEDRGYRRAITTLRDGADSWTDGAMTQTTSRETPMADEPTAEDVLAMAQHPLAAVWRAGGDAATSEDFRDANGDLDEAAYVRYGLNVMRQVHAEVVAAARAAGYAEAVQALRALVEANYHPASGHGTLLRSVLARMEKLAAAASAPSATTEEPTP